MADVLRIKRRVSGSPGAPTSLANAELAFNEVDDTLYYGKGTGGAGGSATAVIPIGGPGMGSTNAPLMDGVAVPGTSALFSKGDHVHPTDTSRAPLASPVFTGDPQAPTPTPGDNDNSIATTGFVTTALANGVAGFAPINNPVLTGDPQAVTQPNTDNDTSIATTAFVHSVRLDQMALPQADLDINGHILHNVLDPVQAGDAATKQYVDLTTQGLDGKLSVRAATTANIALTGTQTVDDVALVSGDRCLVKNQTTTAENGIYDVKAGAWTRSLDMDVWPEFPSAYTFVEEGTTNADTGWLCTVNQGGTLGTTPVTWTQFSGAGQITAGAGLIKTGSQIDVVGTAGRIIANADSIDIDSGYVGQTSLTTLGTVTTGTWNGTTIAVAYGGTGAVSLTGYVKGNGTSAMTASATIPNTDITGLGTMSTQNANAVAITGGTIDGVTFDMGTF